MSEEVTRKMQSNNEANSSGSDQLDPTEVLYRFFGGEHNRLVAFLLSRDHNLDLATAQDLVADLLLRLVNRVVPLAPIRNLSAYIFRSLNNLQIDQKRRSKRSVPLESSVVSNGEELSLLDILTGEDSTVLEIEQTELRARLFEAIESLKPDQRAVVVANMLMGRTFEELSSEWQTPIGTLMARKHRAIKVLREKLSDLDPRNDE